MLAQRGLTFEQFEIGTCYEAQGRTVTEADVVAFAGLSGDFNVLHTNAEFGKATPFGDRIAHGALVFSMATGMANWTGVFDGTTLALMQQTVTYKAPVRFGDTVHLQLEVIEKKETSKPDRGVVKFAARMINQNDEVVQEGEWTLLMKRAEGA